MNQNSFFSLLLLVVLSGCASPKRTTPAPRFPSSIMAPVAIRIVDRRPEVERGNVPDPDFIYFRAQGSGQTDLLVDYLGNALTMFQVTPGYVRVGADARPTDAQVFIDLTYLQGYARWPSDTNQRLSHIPVEGATKMKYVIYVDGKRAGQGQLKEEPSPFKVPVSIITQRNVRSVVSDALAYQFDKATTDLLDEFLWHLADAWPGGSN